MAIDFTLAPEHEEIRNRVHVFVEDTIKPAVEPFGHRETMKDEQLGDYIRTLIGLRGKAKEAGLWLPHMPEEWGGMGLGHVALAMVQAESAKTRVGPLGPQLHGPRRGQHAHPAALGHRRAEGEVPPPALRRRRRRRASP